MTPYEILGVSRDAGPDDLKRAYRRKASVLHPDRGGGVAQFQELQRAYDILSDPKKREEYDKFGGYTEGMRERAGALEEVAKLIMQLIEQLPNPHEIDLIEVAKTQIHDSRKGMNAARAAQLNQRDKFERLLNRFKKKTQGPDNFMEGLFRKQMRDCDRQVAHLDNLLKRSLVMLEVLEDYTFEHDVPQYASTNMVYFSSGGFR